MSTFHATNPRSAFDRLARRNLPPAGSGREPEVLRFPETRDTPANRLLPVDDPSEPWGRAALWQLVSQDVPEVVESGRLEFLPAQMMLVEVHGPEIERGAPDADESEADDSGENSPPLMMAAWELAYDTVEEIDDDDLDGGAGAPEPGVIPASQTATVEFWVGVRGQGLIRSWNGGPLATVLGCWLADEFPSLYGEGGPHDLGGKPNNYVAALCRRLSRESGPRAEAQVLATSLAVYATTAALGGPAGTSAGFLVTEFGVGACPCDVGTAGSAFGVMNGSCLTVRQLLRALAAGSRAGQLLAGDPERLREAGWLLGLVNQSGGLDG